MKDKIFGVLQRVGRSFMLPIAILPVAGLLLGFGSSFTNETTIATYGLEKILGDGTILNALLIIMNKVGSAVFDNLPLIFAVGVAIGMAKKEKEVAALSALIAYFVMNVAINGMLVVNDKITADGQIAKSVLEGTVTSVCGIQSLQMGVFGGIIVGLGVALGYDAMFGFAIIAVGEFVGFMGATLNPYSVGIAQTISGVELYSGTGYRAICFVIFMAISIIYVMVYGRKIKKNPDASVVFGEKNIHAFDRDELNEYSFTLKDGLVLLDVLVVLIVLMLGLIKWGWDFPQLCGLFLLMSMIAAAICKWSPNKWCSEFIDSAKTAMWGCILTGIAKAITVVMQDAQIMDTVIYGLSNVLKNAPHAACSTDSDQLFHTICNRSGFCNHADHGTAGRYYWCEQTDSSSCIPVWRRTFQYFLADGRYRYHLWPGWNFPAAILLGIATGIGF